MIISTSTDASSFGFKIPTRVSTPNDDNNNDDDDDDDAKNGVDDDTPNLRKQLKKKKKKKPFLIFNKTQNNTGKT